MSDETVEMLHVQVLPDRRVSRKHAAVVLDRKPKTLAEWKMKGWGPRPITVGGREFYSYDECLAMARGEKPIKPAGAANTNG